jgi:hypothetical protein
MLEIAENAGIVMSLIPGLEPLGLGIAGGAALARHKPGDAALNLLPMAAFLRGIRKLEGAGRIVNDVIALGDEGARLGPLSGKLNAPRATDAVLQDAFRNLWRPQDIRPGGTIGELLREIEAGGELKHLEKAEGRLKQLIDRVNDTTRPLSKADRAGAERVINDLKDAIRKARDAKAAGR